MTDPRLKSSKNPQILTTISVMVGSQTPLLQNPVLHGVPSGSISSGCITKQEVLRFWKENSQHWLMTFENISKRSYHSAASFAGIWSCVTHAGLQILSFAKGNTFASTAFATIDTFCTISHGKWGRASCCFAVTCSFLKKPKNKNLKYLITVQDPLGNSVWLAKKDNLMFLN